MNKNNKISPKTISIILSVIFILFITATISIFNNYSNKVNKLSIDKNRIIPKEINIQISDDNTSENRVINKYIKNIALLGIDSDNDDIGRSDCILIATLDTEHNKIKLSSIIRDSYVTIPTHSQKDKINHAYAFGGPELTLQTLNNNFYLDITQFVSVNFSSFPKIIDTIGGINLNITNDELNYINTYIQSLNESNGTNSPNITEIGLQSVDGTQALAYARIRYTDGGDFERSHRQRIVIEQILRKLQDIPIVKYPIVLDTLLPMINTNLSSAEILSLCFDISSLENYEIIEERFPKDEDAEGKCIKGVYNYVFNKDATISKIHDFINED